MSDAPQPAAPSRNRPSRRGPAAAVSASNRTPLSRERIVAAALAEIEREGLGGFSIRRLGTALGCEPMSLYHHFPSKAHLLDALVDLALAEIDLAPAHDDPIERLRAIAYSYRRMAKRHPQLYPLLAVHRLNTPTGVRVIDRVLELVRTAVPAPRLAAQFFRVLGYYITGASLDETAGYAKGPSAAEPVSDAFIAEHCPHLAAAARYFKSEWRDETFALGLDAVLASMRAAASAAPPATGAKPVIHPKR